MRDPEFIHLDACDFENYPSGGTLSFSIQMRKVFGARVALAGIVTDNTPCGKWIEKKIDGVTYPFFGICKVSTSMERPIIPRRLSSFLFLKKNLGNLKKIGVGKIFTQTPQFMFLLKKHEWEKICFCFAGTANSISISRYPFFRWMGGVYERRLFENLSSHAKSILAAADQDAIDHLILRSKGILRSNDVRSFPTRFDDNVFHYKDKDKCRDIIGLPLNRTIIAVNGRLSWVKGWRFILETFREYLNIDPRALLIFIGDGEDRYQVEEESFDLINKDNVRLIGRIPHSHVSNYLGASDLIMVGSFEEGWSTAMIEALACCKPIITTNVSGAKDMVVSGENGFILEDRDPKKASTLIQRTLCLPYASETSHQLSKAYKLSNLKSDIQSLFLNS